MLSGGTCILRPSVVINFPDPKTMKLAPSLPAILLFTFSLLTILGCGDMPASVTGKITVNGETHENLRVTFIPEAGGASVYGSTDANGEFQLNTGQKKGLIPGEYRVTVSGFSKNPSPTMTAAQVKALRIVPLESSDRNKTPHRADVQPGSNEFSYDL